MLKHVRVIVPLLVLLFSLLLTVFVGLLRILITAAP